MVVRVGEGVREVMNALREGRREVRGKERGERERSEVWREECVCVREREALT